tara:strand:+ start:460 stop:615 length:156 start_codon:yes stop_codon:yes gene_type:complete
VTGFQFLFALLFGIFAGWCMWFGNGKKKEMIGFSVFFGLAVFVFWVSMALR